MSIDEAREYCDRVAACEGFSLNVAVAPSTIAGRSEIENSRGWIRFTRTTELFYTSTTGMSVVHGSWVAYTKSHAMMIGQAANVGAQMGTSISWLVQPGFIVAPEATEEQMEEGSSQLIRYDEYAKLHEEIEWCAAQMKCEGVTHALPSGGMPLDRLQAASYCCRVDVRTTQAQQSWTKWAPPTRGTRQRADIRMAELAGAGTTSGHPKALPRGTLRGRRPAGGGAAGGFGDDTLNGDENEEDEEDDEDDDEDDEDDEGPDGAEDEEGSRLHAAEIGFVANGFEIHSGFLTTSQAYAWCSRHTRCASFTCRVPERDTRPSVVLYFSFHDAGGRMVHHPDW
jgi:hypothetical protein